MTDYYADKLTRHGLWAMLVALIAGFLLIFSMIGGMALDPLPVLIEFEMPGSTKGWRILHLGMLMNGMMAILLASAMRPLLLNERKAFLISTGVAIAVWGNFAFYLFGMFAPNHGVTLQGTRLGEASLAGAAAFVPALVGAVTLIAALWMMLGSERQKSDKHWEAMK